MGIPTKHLFLTTIMIYLLIITLSVGRAQDNAPIETAYVTWSPDGNYLAIAGLDEVNVFDISTQQVVNSFPTSVILIAPISWSADGQQLGFSSGKTFQIWSNPTTIPHLEITIPDYAGAEASDWHPNSQIIALSYGEYTSFWNIQTQTWIRDTLTEVSFGGVWSLDWNKQGTKILIGGGLAVIVLNYETETVETVFSIEPFLNRYQEYINPVAFSVAWSPSEEQIAIGSDDAVRVLNLSDYTDEQYVMLSNDSFFYGHTGEVFSVSWHPNEQYLASSGRDGTIRVWDVTTREQVYLIEFPDNTFVRSVAWSPDGTQLAYGSPDGEPEAIIIPTSDILPTVTDES